MPPATQTTSPPPPAGSKPRILVVIVAVIVGVGVTLAVFGLRDTWKSWIGSRTPPPSANVLFVRPARHPAGPPTMVQTMTPDDTRAILALPGVKAVSPVYMNSGQIRAESRISNTAAIAGVLPSLLAAQNYRIDCGRTLNDSDVGGRARVAVLGAKTAEDLFPRQDFLGRVVQIDGIPFHVVGRNEAMGSQEGFNLDDQVFIPYPTAVSQISPSRTSLRCLAVETGDGGSAASVAAEINKLLRRRHRLRGEAADNFAVETPAEFLETFRKARPPD